MNVSAVLLAGGESRRFGRDKATFAWKGTTLWELQLQTLRELEPLEIIISARTDPAWRPADVRFVPDAAPSRGPLSGLTAALASMRSSHLLALAIDMPLMTSLYLGSLISLVTVNSGIVPMMNGQPEPLAAIYPRAAENTVAAMLAKGSDLALRSLIGHLLRAGRMQPVAVDPNDFIFFHNVNELADAGIRN
jgi:molybdopterin-guanine dinucleotide biosynthesis protein A